MTPSLSETLAIYSNVEHTSLVYSFPYWYCDCNNPKNSDDVEVGELAHESCLLKELDSLRF